MLLTLFKNFTPLKVTGLYFFIASLWSIINERYFDEYITSIGGELFLHTLDELLFVLLTSVLLYGLLRLKDRQDRKIGELLEQTQDEQNLLRRTFDSMKSAILLIDTNSRTIVDCNRSAERIFGYSRNELVGSSTRILHASDESYRQFDEMGEQVLGEKGIFNTEFQMRRKDGSEFVSDHTVSLVYSDDGEVIRAVSVVRDITEKKRNEQEIRQRRRRLERAQKIAKIADWEYNPETEEIYWSPMMFEIFDRDADRGPPSYDELSSMYMADEEKHNQAVEQAIKNGESYDLELELKTEKDNDKYIRAIGLPQQDDNGEVVKLVGIVQDITERHRMQKALRESERRFRAITDNVPGIVYRYRLNTDGTDEVSYLSRGSEKIMGLTPEQIKQNLDLVWERIEPDGAQKLKKRLQKSASEMTRLDVEWQYHHPEGTKRWHRAIGVPHQEDDGSVVWDLVLVDITDQKKVQEQMMQSVIVGEDRERRRMAKELHDGIAQYLAAANMNFESARPFLHQLPEKQQQRVEKGRRLVKQAISETRNISQNLMPRVLEDYGIVKAIQALFENYENTKNVTFKFDQNIESTDLPHQVQLNIYRMIQECVNNAIKYANCSTISLQMYEMEQNLYITFEDDGKGVELSTLKDSSGFGIGSLKSRTQVLSGTIDIDSAPGKGMVISIEIPLQTDQEETKV